MRVFIVATHALHRMAVMDRLEGLGHETVGMAGSLAEAARRATKLRPLPDAIVAEHELIDGDATRLGEIVPGVPILAFLERDAELSEETKLRYAAVVRRPFDPATLAAGVQALAFWTGADEDDEADTV